MSNLIIHPRHLPLRVDRTHPQLEGCVGMWCPPLTPSVATIPDYMRDDGGGGQIGDDVTWDITALGSSTTTHIRNSSLASTIIVPHHEQIDPLTNDWSGYTLIIYFYVVTISTANRGIVMKTSQTAGRGVYGVELLSTGKLRVHGGSHDVAYYNPDNPTLVPGDLVFLGIEWDAIARYAHAHYKINNQPLMEDATGGSLSSRWRENDLFDLYFGAWDLHNASGNNRYLQVRLYDRNIGFHRICDIYDNLYAPFIPADPEPSTLVEAGEPPIIVPAVPDTAAGADDLGPLQALLETFDSSTNIDDIPSGYPLATLSPIADTGATSDSTTPADASFIIYESSPATDDSLVVSIQFSIGDTATGADIIDVVGSTFNQVLDSGLGTDNAVIIKVSIPMSDAGNSIDTASLIANVRVTDTTGSVDIVNVLTEVLKIASDTGAGFDAINIPQACHDDFAFSVDTIPYPTVTLIIPDVGIASQEVIDAIIQTIEIIDSATGADVVIPITASVIANDSGFGSDVSEIIQAFVTIAETAGADDVVIAFESGTRIARISFKLRRKRITFKLQ